MRMRFRQFRRLVRLGWWRRRQCRRRRVSQGVRGGRRPLIRFDGAKVGQLVVLVDKVRNVFGWWCRRQCRRLLRKGVRRRVVPRRRRRCCRARRQRQVRAFLRRRLVRRGRFCPRVERFKLFRELFRLVGSHLGWVRRVLLALLQSASRSGRRFPALAERFRNVGRLPFRILDSLAILRCVFTLGQRNRGVARRKERGWVDVPRWRFRQRWKAARGSWRRRGTSWQSICVFSTRVSSSPRAVEPHFHSVADAPCRLSSPVFVIGLREQLQAKVFDVCAGSYIVCECLFCRVLGLGLYRGSRVRSAVSSPPHPVSDVC